LRLYVMPEPALRATLGIRMITQRSDELYDGLA
jgi:hypothetical protein